MKNGFIILLVMCSILSCKKENEYKFDINNYPQKWELTESQTWQEYYLLDANGTFIKHRELDGQIMEVSGTFTFKKLSDGMYLELEYSSGNELIGSCHELKEEFFLESDEKLKGTWSYCDGPYLEYKRVR